MTKLLANGITVTAIHNHLLRVQLLTSICTWPDRRSRKLATALHDALGASATPFGTVEGPVQRTPLAASAGVTIDVPAAGLLPR
jgi:hypothetical protein